MDLSILTIGLACDFGELGTERGLDSIAESKTARSQC